MLVVVASYRQNVHAYPSGGGDYEVATTNLGPRVGIAVASALMVDYTLTVAVSVSSGVANLASAFPVLNPHVTLIAVLVVAVIAVMNLRGVRESGTAFAIPTYLLHRRGRADDRLGLPPGWRPEAACGPRAPGCTYRSVHELHRAPAGLPAAARVLLRLHRADRGGGDQQRRARLPQAQEQERGHDAGAARNDRGVHVRGRDRAGPDQPRAHGHPGRHDRAGPPGRPSAR